MLSTAIITKGAKMPRCQSGRRRQPDLSHIAEPLRPLAVPVSTLVHDPHNARIHGEDNAAAIEGSLRRFGQRQVITYNPSLGNRVITGNERLRVARDVLGWSHIAALAVVEDEQSSVGYAIADNRTAELAGFNTAALEEAMRLAGPGLNEQLDQMMVQLARDMNITPPDTLPEPPRNARRGRGGDEMPEGDTMAGGVLIDGEAVQTIPEEVAALKASRAAYVDAHGTDAGYIASLLEAEATAQITSAPATTEPATPTRRRSRR